MSFYVEQTYELKGKKTKKKKRKKTGIFVFSLSSEWDLTFISIMNLGNNLAIQLESTTLGHLSGSVS